MKYYYPAGPKDKAPPGWTCVELPGSRNGVNQLLAQLGEFPPIWALDLVTIAEVVYLVDNLAQRKGTPDRWTRSLPVSIPVIEPDRQPVQLLERLLGTITSDVWHIEFRQGRTPDHQPAIPVEGPPRSVALFSGGLDSLSYAATRPSRASQPVVLVSHWNHTGLKPIQEELAKTLGRSGIALETHQFSVMPNSGQSGADANEPSTRSRAFLFLAAGVMVAAAYGVPELAVPENGMLALNPPLTRGRPGSCTTRSTHPRTLQLFNDLLRALGADVRATNPYLPFTKGQVCELARDEHLSDAAIARSVTCGAPGRIQHRNCGYCYPCLVRRAGLRKAFRNAGGDPTRYYGKEPWKSPALTNGQPASRRPQRLADFTAMVHWLGTEFTMRDVTAGVALADDMDLEQAFCVVRRSRKELVAMLDEEMSADVKKALGWSPRP